MLNLRLREHSSSSLALQGKKHVGDVGGYAIFGAFYFLIGAILPEPQAVEEFGCRHKLAIDSSKGLHPHIQTEGDLMSIDVKYRIAATATEVAMEELGPRMASS